MDVAALIDDQLLIHPITDTAGTGNNLFLLRDDLLPFGLGGNKVRIAVEFVEDMKSQGKDAMIAYGSSASNMCRVIANLCKAEGIPCTVILSGSDHEGAPCNNQLLMGLYGARAVHCTTQNIAQTVREAFAFYEEQGRKPYYIFGNELGQGNEHVAARAYAKAYRGIAAWAKEHGLSFDRIFCASGTQSTQAGLICGHILAQDACHIEGIMISSRSEERAKQAILEASCALLGEKGCPATQTAVEGEINLITDQRKGGYGLYDQEVLDCISQQLCTNGFPTDPIYTGKAFLGMQHYLTQHAIHGENILFVHTGGEPIFYDALKEGQLR